jgi:lipopolysaccharide transport system ATP-binding protein
MSSESVAREPAPPDAAPAIHARGLAKTYRVYARPADRLREMLRLGRGPYHREFHAVRGVDFDVYRGETFGVVGRNGSGKSTLLKLVCGLLDKSAGELDVRGHLAPILTLGAGFDPAFTGRENAVLNAAVLGLPDAEIRERIEAIEDFADIGPFFDQPVQAYSSGMYARLAFAVAIHADPDILVVDEVLAVGDEAFTRKCAARIEAIKARGATILFVSHSATLVLELCDRVMLLEHGEVLRTGDPKTVLGCYQMLLHAPVAEQPRIDAEIRSGRVGAAALQARGSDGSSAGSSSPSAYGYFAAELAPESTLHYESDGARIAGATILAPDGQPVNVLIPGQVYTYGYEVHFSKAARRVRFGMMLKLVTGFELAGQSSHASGEGLPEVAAGTRLRVRFRFVPALAPGAYFVNAGVLGERDGSEVFLHRIIDAVMFRVEHPRSPLATGYVDLSTQEPAEVVIEAVEAD